MNNSELARQLGKTPQAISKWPKSKRDEAIRNLKAGVNPIVAELVGELQRECYVAGKHIDKSVWLDVSRNKFTVLVLGDQEKIAESAPLNPYELQGAIVKVKELYK